MSDLSDGVALAAAASLYRPTDLSWSELALGDPPSMADSLYNIQMLQRFCNAGLPFNVFHVTIEDVVYMHASIKQNVLSLAADLYDVLEARPKQLRGADNILPGVTRTKVIEVPDSGTDSSH